jgi:alpha-glucosidase
MLAGPVDFHSGSFRNVLRRDYHPENTAPVTIGTRAHQLARYVVYDDYLPMIADSPAAYRDTAGLDLMVKMPVTWDETRVLEGEIGKFLATARRRGRIWYVGGMAGPAAHEIALPLSFLPSGPYRAEFYTDDPSRPDEPTRLATERKELRASDILHAKLAPAGGVVVKLTPIAYPRAPRRVEE